MKLTYKAPTLEKYEGVIVANDQAEGGTKARFLYKLFERADSVAYASSAEGTAQVALSAVAHRLGKKAFIFGPARAQLSPRQAEVIKLGGGFIPCRPGYMNVCQSRATTFARRNGCDVLPFGATTPDAVDEIATCAESLKVKPDFIWCASGSGTLIQGLVKCWPKAQAHVTQVGHVLTAGEVSGATIHVSPYKYQQQAPDAGFDCDRHYEAKAWAMMQAWRAATKPRGSILFWSVTTAAQA